MYCPEFDRTILQIESGMTTIELKNEQSFACGSARVQVFQSRKSLGIAAAKDAAFLIEQAIRQRGNARVMIATGNSQLDVSEELVHQPGIDWKRVDVFHMDEYVGIDASHPASFRRWIKERIEDRVHPASMSYIQGDAKDLEAEIDRYTQLLSAGPMDVAFVGFGENGHIAFNDPAGADFFDPLMVRCVTLDPKCRAQQVGEGHFATTDDVPAQAITVSCSGLLRAQAWISCVPERRKAEAVRDALTGDISVACPASIVRLHLNTSIYLDTESASLL
jgi:glucosamine-6-phosphate deaminase